MKQIHNLDVNDVSQKHSLMTLNDKKTVKKVLGDIKHKCTEKTCVSILYAQSWIGIWLNERAPGPWLE